MPFARKRERERARGPAHYTGKSTLARSGNRPLFFLMVSVLTDGTNRRRAAERNRQHPALIAPDQPLRSQETRAQRHRARDSRARQSFRDPERQGTRTTARPAGIDPLRKSRERETGLARARSIETFRAPRDFRPRELVASRRDRAVETSRDPNGRARDAPSSEDDRDTVARRAEVPVT